ncbi:MAG TPA: MoaD/ThiS family protein [Candidatus Deferrimicrobium sp.]|nr:MoaD/ThiS family protein [Candidatus Deferrimicrobium sp.]
MIKVRIPTPLRPLTKGKGEVDAQAGTIVEMIDTLNASHPGIKDRLCDDTGELRRFVNIYVNEEDIRFLKGKETSLKDGDEVSIVPAIAGGTSCRT